MLNLLDSVKACGCSVSNTSVVIAVCLSVRCNLTGWELFLGRYLHWDVQGEPITKHQKYRHGNLSMTKLFHITLISLTTKHKFKKLSKVLFSVFLQPNSTLCLQCRLYELDLFLTIRAIMTALIKTSAALILHYYNRKPSYHNLTSYVAIYTFSQSSLCQCILQRCSWTFHLTQLDFQRSLSRSCWVS